ncbi:MAG: hypothetical protein K8I65_01430 [Thermoanaerobaculia bacterium]|nr:hypothetical protein [Thermoanaerobaculia bacterium]
MLRRVLPAATLLVALATALLPLASPASMGGHSSLIELVRVEAIHLAVAAGDLLPRWLPDLYGRHGSPLPIYYAPLAYVPVELLRACGFAASAAIQATFALFWLLAAAGAAWAARSWFGRGARGPGPRTLAGGALATAALVLAHNITALFGAAALATLAIAGPRPARRHVATLAALGLLLSAAFWLPALAGTGDVRAEESLTTGHFDFHRHFLALADLLPGRAAVVLPSAAGAERPVRFGELLWLALLSAPWVARRAGATAPERRRRVWLLAALTVAALAMTTPLSRPLWEVVPGLRYVQFPFRWLLPATVGAALLAGAAVTALPLRWRPHASALAAATALWLVGPLLEPRYVFFDRERAAPVWVERAQLEQAREDPRLVSPDAWFDAATLHRRMVTGTSSDDYLPRSVTARVPPAGPAAEPLAAGIEVVTAGWGYPEVRAEVAVTAAAPLALHQFDFPGWRVEVDGTPRAHRTEAGRGRIVVDLAPGDRRVVARFGPTPLGRFAAGLSLVAAVLLAVAVRRAARRERPPAGC